MHVKRKEGGGTDGRGWKICYREASMAASWCDREGDEKGDVTGSRYEREGEVLVN